ncbi:MAG: hypothetical protein AB7K24_27245 [Gemmataceae bacterium]
MSRIELDIHNGTLLLTDADGRIGAYERQEPVPESEAGIAYEKRRGYWIRIQFDELRTFPETLNVPHDLLVKR